mmetsp:Transcript_35322/g.89192  ORF Transcript_35322/g.89192 Transcript_35322/m.89192 type:complete len:600 (-) Transcript_35322:987-2786(-)
MGAELDEFGEQDEREYNDLFENVGKKAIKYVLDQHVACMTALSRFTELDVAIELRKHVGEPPADTVAKLVNATVGVIWSLEAVKRSVELQWLKFDCDTPFFIRQRERSELWVRKQSSSGACDEGFEMERVKDDYFKTFAIVSKADVLQKLSNVHYYALAPRKQWKQFGPDWLRHPKIRSCSLLMCDPTRRVDDEKIFNIWQGFAAEDLPKVHTHDIASLVKPILDHLEMLLDHDCGESSVKSSRYVLAWLAQQVRRPHERSKVAIILRGKQGVGKDVVFEQFWMPRVLGYQVCHQTEDVETILGKHAKGLENSVFVLFDEANNRNLGGVLDRMKSIITKDSTHEINPKGKAQYKINLLANFLFTTNNERPIEIAHDDRRYAAFLCSDAKMQDSDYFTPLIAHLKETKVARAFFQYLQDEEFAKVDLTKIPATLERKRLIIQTQAEARQNLGCMTKFLSYWSLSQKGQGGGSPRKVLSEHVIAELSVWIKTTDSAAKDTHTPKWVGDELSKYSKLGEAQTGISETMTMQPWNVRGRRVDYANLEGWLRKQDTFDESAVEDLDCASMLAQVAESCQCKKCTHARDTAGVVIQTGTSGADGM